MRIRVPILKFTRHFARIFTTIIIMCGKIGFESNRTKLLKNV